jgi:aspartate/methionine/tyrosine aminotransferase
MVRDHRPGRGVGVRDRQGAALTFSRRLPDSTALNAVARARDALRARDVPVLDLTISNPTEAGFSYPSYLLAPLSDPRGRTYVPAPLGLQGTREAVARAISRPGLEVSPDRVVLTASTSEAYGLLFKLLCDPGAGVLVPQPSYPLFDLLTRLEGVVPQPYRLDYHGIWSIDRASLEHALTTDTRAILVVSPNNPTGAFLRAADREWLAALAADRGLAIISDEVFADYPLAARPDATTMAGESRALTFVLGGLSKSAGLPQVKLGWIVADGPADRTADALRRLEIICDTYLSVSTPVQLAASSLIDAGVRVQRDIAGRLLRNLEALRAALAAFPSVQLLEPEGGWSAVLRVPSTRTEEALVLRLLDRANVHVHPGFFFDFADEAYVVVSLLTPTEDFDRGVARVLPIAAGGRP